MKDSANICETGGLVTCEIQEGWGPQGKTLQQDTATINEPIKL
jgi:hypothetical protein